MIDFNEFFLESGTDKIWHQYGMIYNIIFNGLLGDKDKLSILEVGVFRGCSVQAWANSGIFEKIVGVTIDDNIIESARKDLSKIDYSNVIANAYTDETIDLILENHGKFDIVLDDGSHYVKDQLWFLDNYKKLLNPNGVIICEDVKFKELDNFKNKGFYIIDVRSNKNSLNINDDDIIVIDYNSHRNKAITL